jgi:uncharacterized protein YciI
MKTNLLRFSAILALLAMVGIPVLLAADSQEPAKKSELKQFIIVLHLSPRLHDDKAWTEEDKATLGKHFQQLKAATEKGQVILAGRTEEPASKTFGIIIFEAADEAAARAFMENDPAVVAKAMTAEVHPFNVVLQRSSAAK